MKLLKYFLNALDALWRNKLRSALSTLWIVIWIASVTIMLALWEWLKQKMLESLSVSNDVISITQKQDYGWWVWPDWKPLKKEESYVQVKEVFIPSTIDEIKKYIKNIKYVIALWSKYWFNVKYEWKDLYPWIVWVTTDYIKWKWLKIVDWYNFTQKQFDENQKVVILWNDLVKNDLWGKNPIWKSMMIWWYSFEVIWVLDKSTDWNVNYSILIPFSTAQKRMWVDKFSNIYIYVDDILKLNQTKKDVLFLLMKLSDVWDPSSVKFWIESNDEAIKEINKTIMQMQLFLWWIAWISLLVWWIWIMNIMLVSVIERTREIWIRKAIWAKKRDILIQFLTESVVISILWCIIAFLLSLWWVYLINKYSPIPAKFSINVVMFSSLVAVAMWVIFWIIPAWKASKMKPIDALRFE